MSRIDINVNEGASPQGAGAPRAATPEETQRLAGQQQQQQQQQQQAAAQPAVPIGSVTSISGLITTLLQQAIVSVASTPRAQQQPQPRAEEVPPSPYPRARPVIGPADPATGQGPVRRGFIAGWGTIEASGSGGPAAEMEPFAGARIAGGFVPGDPRTTPVDRDIHGRWRNIAGQYIGRQFYPPPPPQPPAPAPAGAGAPQPAPPGAVIAQGLGGGGPPPPQPAAAAAPGAGGGALAAAAGVGAVAGFAFAAIQSVISGLRQLGTAISQANRRIVRGLTSDPTTTDVYAGVGATVRGVGGAMGKIAPPLQPIVALLGEGLNTLEEMSRGVDRMADSIVGLSPEVTVADALVEVRLLTARLERAERIGEMMGDIRMQRGQIREQMMDISTRFMEMFGPLIQNIDKNLLRFLRLVEVWLIMLEPDIKMAVGTAKAVRAAADYVPLLGEIKWFVESMAELLDKAKDDWEGDAHLAEIDKFLDPARAPIGEEYYAGRSGPPKPGRPFARGGRR